MLVYLKGISRVDLENVTNFLYNGETLVSHQELNAFLETVQELKVTGFQTVKDENKSNLDVSENDLYSRIDIPHEDTQVHRTIANDTFQQDLTTIPSETKIIVPVENIDQEVQLTNLIEKHSGGWKCKVCNKTAKYASIIRQHAEIHIQGAMHSCSICKKTFSTSTSLRTHVNNIHSKLYFCKDCGREDMNKMTLQKHKKNCPGTPEEQM